MGSVDWAPPALSSVTFPGLPVPVHLTYFTVWATRPGALQVFEDVYELNGELLTALR